MTYFRLRNFTNDNAVAPWATEAWYTLNDIDEVEVAGAGEAGARGKLAVQVGVGPERGRSVSSVFGLVDRGDADGWRGRWRRGDGREAGAGAGRFDFQLHAEFLAPAGGSGELAANSGIKIQRRYELQILNTPATALIGSFTSTDAGSLYGLRRSDRHASTGPNTWQNYDVFFTAARWSGATKLTNARLTAFWNGVLIHDDSELPVATANSPPEAAGPAGILLQDGTNNATGEVQFRNIWVIPTSTNAQPDANPAKDGLTNLWKYATGANPTVPSLAANGHSFVPAMQVFADETGNRYLQFTHLRRIDYAERGLYFTVETSPDMNPGNWTRQPASEVGSVVATGDGFTEMATLRVNTPLAPGTGQVFARVKAELLQ